VRKLLLAGAMLVFAAPAYAADTLPDAMIGGWGFEPNGGEGMVRAPDGGDFFIEKDKYSGVDNDCTILKVEKLAENLYTVQASCLDYGNDTTTISLTSLNCWGMASCSLTDVDEQGRVVTAIYLATVGAFSVGAIEKANQVFQPDDRF
jgi:hypothetical protein